MKKNENIGMNYPQMDYHNYPTAPRNYPLNYQQNSSSSNRNSSTDARKSTDNYYYSQNNEDNVLRSQNLPQNHGSLPRNNENFPKNQHFPRSQENFPRSQENFPRSQENFPRSQENFPRSQENFPRSQENYPRNQDNFPRSQENFPRSQENFPRSQENYPRSQNYPKNHESLPRNRENFPRNEENFPRSQNFLRDHDLDRQETPPSYQRHSTHFEHEFIQPHKQPRTVDDYHHAYRGGYRPGGGRDTDGYTTDGSGSWRGQAPDNPRYTREKDWLLPKYYEGNTYPRGDGERGGGSLEGEKAPFLTGIEPVRLTPSWEQSNHPKDELNFGTLSAYENFEIACTDPPKDRYRLVFLVLVLHGVGVLMPWNMFITAKNYFVEYKLNTDDENVSTYATNFLPYIGYASQIPNVLFNWLNVFINMGGNLTSRIVWSLLVEVVIFVVTVVLAMIDSAQWPGVFFWITIVSVVILNVAGGIYQNTVYGMAARLPFSYTGAVVLGNNISGTFTALINILAIALAPNIRTSAIYYFITALFVLLACFDTYFALPLNRFYRYHETKHIRKSKTATDRNSIRTPYWHIFKSAFPQLFNVFLVFFVTLAVFPAVLADTCRTEANFPIPPKYYQAVTCFLTFNLFAMLGNMLPALFTWPSPRYLCVPVILRLFLIPAFVLCHFYPVKAERIMPVLIDSDWAYWALSVVLGLTSGYYSSLAMMYCPRTVEPEHAPVAGMMGAASLMTGIFTGIVFQIVCTYAVTNLTFEIPGYEFPFRNCTDRIA